MHNCLTCSSNSSRLRARLRTDVLDFVARRLYEMAAVCVMSHLLLQDATKAPELFGKSLNVYVNYAESEVEKHFNFIRKFNAEELANYRK